MLSTFFGSVHKGVIFSSRGPIELCYIKSESGKRGKDGTFSHLQLRMCSSDQRDNAASYAPAGQDVIV